MKNGIGGNKEDVGRNGIREKGRKKKKGNGERGEKREEKERKLKGKNIKLRERKRWGIRKRRRGEE